MTAPVIYSAGQQLAALVTAIRLDDWSPEDVHAVIAGAHQVGITWERTVVGLVSLAIDPEAKPRDLIPVHQDPLRHQDPVRAKRGAEEVRKALANTREDTP